MTALHRAVTLEEVHHIALAIGENLHLDVLRFDDCGLQVHAAVSERRLRLARSLGRLFAQLILGFHEAHAAPAATGDSLNEYREVKVLGVFHQLIDVRRWLRVPQRRQPGFLCCANRRGLITGEVQRAWGRANELNAIVFTRTG